MDKRKMTRLILQEAEYLFLYLKDKESSTVDDLCNYLKAGGFNIDSLSTLNGILNVAQCRFPLKLKRRKGIYSIKVKN